MKKILSIALSLLMIISLLATVPMAGALIKELGPDMVEWTEENEFLYDGNAHTRLVQVTDGETPLLEGVDYTISYYTYAGEEFEQIEIMPYEIGEYCVRVTGIGAYQGEADNEYSIIADTAKWGMKTENAGVLNYVDEDGTTGAEVKKNNAVWLKEESGGTSAWYGIDQQSAAQFQNGSRFWVRWLSAEDDEDLFQTYYNQLDEEQKANMEDNKVWIFLTGVTDPDGNEYTNLDNPLSYFVQLGDDWDKEDIGAVCISEQKDEELEAEWVDNFTCPEGETEFAKITLKHFSAYAVFVKGEPEVDVKPVDTEFADAEDVPEVVAENTEPAAQNTTVTSPDTGDHATAVLFAATLAAGVGVIALGKRKKED